MDTSDTGKGLHTPYLLLYSLFIAVISWYSYNHPVYNPDMLYYMAIAKGIDNNNYRATHKEVYQNAKDLLPSISYNNLTDTLASPMAYKYHNPDLFYQTIPSHALKPLYNSSIRIFEWLGFNPVKSTIMPGIISFIMMAFLFYFWIQNYLKTGLALIISMSILCTAPFISTIRLSTPDMMAAALFFFSGYLLFERKNIIPAFIVMVLSIYTRIDFLIPSIAFLMLVFFRKDIKTREFISYFLFFIMIFFSLFFIVRDFGWGPFYFMDYMDYYDHNPLHQEIKYNHFHTVASAFFDGLRRTHLAVFAFIGMIPFIALPRKDWFNWSSDTMLIMMIFCVIAIRIILHPNVGDRFFLAYYLLLTILAVKNITLQFKRNPNVAIV